jgi:sporulation protein YlmC with PRC-barrel domain
MPVQPLSELEQDWQLVDSNKDIRGRRLVDESGDELGTIEQMIVNTDHERVESVRTNRGELYPVGALELQSDRVIFHGVKPTGRSIANMDDPYRIRRTG